MDKLLLGQEKCPLIFIQDSLSTKGNCLSLLEEFLVNLLNRCSLVYFLCCERSCTYWEERLTLERNGKRPIFLDGYSDFLSWNSSEQHDNREILIGKDTNLANEVTSDAILKFQTGDISVGLISDSVGPLLENLGLKRFSHMLTGLFDIREGSTVKFHQVVMVAHGDCVSEAVSNSLLYKSKAYIDLLSVGEGNNTSSESFQCRLRHKKISGKYIDEIYHLKHIPGIGLRQMAAAFKPVKLTTDVDQKQEADPAANLPFNLKLTDSEKEARSKITLPYTYTADRQASHLQRSQDEGKVFYQPDEADDYDEEDPDDDLNI